MRPTFTVAPYSPHRANSCDHLSLAPGDLAVPELFRRRSSELLKIITDIPPLPDATTERAHAANGIVQAKNSRRTIKWFGEPLPEIVFEMAEREPQREFFRYKNRVYYRPPVYENPPVAEQTGILSRLFRNFNRAPDYTKLWSSSVDRSPEVQSLLASLDNPLSHYLNRLADLTPENFEPHMILPCWLEGFKDLDLRNPDNAILSLIPGCPTLRLALIPSKNDSTIGIYISLDALSQTPGGKCKVANFRWP